LVAVPFEEDDKDSSIWFLDHNYLEQMYKMFKKVNGKSTNFLVGLSESIKDALSQHGKRLWAGIALAPS
jgi:hypothetical protein